jgi:carbon storage regulator
MLIITRHKGQRIAIGPDVEVVVTEISRNGVKLGIVAPASCTILRAEVRDSVERANREAALSQITDPDALLPMAEPEQNTPVQRLSQTPSHVAPPVPHGCQKP